MANYLTHRGAAPALGAVSLALALAFPLAATPAAAAPNSDNTSQTRSTEDNG